MTAAIAPSVVYHSWWPATVLLPKVPGERRQRMLHTTRVYATDQGLFVYGTAGQPGVHLLYSAPIDYTATRKPVNGLPGYAVDVHTTEGELVVVTQTGGCGCGNRTKGFRPDYASRVAAWPA